MSTPNPNDPDYNHVDPDAPVVASARNNNALLWILLLVALVALALWWYGKRPAAEPMIAPVATEQPAVVDEAATTSPADTADKAAAKKPAAKPPAKPKPVAKITRDPSPLASNQAPKYPPQALRSGVEGSVSVRVEVDPSGVPTDVKVVERSGERSRDLDRAVTDAVRKWRFEPAMKDGKAVAGAVVVPVEFKSR
ncbi:MAG: energy transducer TonB [Pseudoxanthomonas sp.]